MTDYNTLQYECRESIATVTTNRPDAMNSFNTEMRAEMADAMSRASADDSIRVVILAGTGRSFSAGADLNESLDREKPVGEVLQTEYRPGIEAINNMPKPVIAAVNGSAAGIGLSFALACDLLIMADNAFMLSPFTTISLVPDGGLNWLLVHQLGYRRAFQLSVESERIPAERCLELGLANKVVPAESLADEAFAWATKLAERAPLSLVATKRAMRLAASSDWGSTFDLEATMQGNLLASDDCAEGVRAFFEKRKPEFKGR